MRLDRADVRQGLMAYMPMEVFRISSVSVDFRKRVESGQLWSRRAGEGWGVAELVGQDFARGWRACIFSIGNGASETEEGRERKEGRKE